VSEPKSCSATRTVADPEGGIGRIIEQTGAVARIVVGETITAVVVAGGTTRERGLTMAAGAMVGETIN
jgi:hypothetical protein